MSREDRVWRDYSARFRREVFPMIASSAVTMQLYSGDGTDFDVKQATELGAMLLLDKPLILVCIRGSIPPTRLAKAADVVLTDFDVSDPSAQDRLADAIKAMSR